MIVNYTSNKIEAMEIWPLAEVKNYLRISHQYDDKLLMDLVNSATEFAAQFSGLILLNKSQIIASVKNALPQVKLKYKPVLVLQDVFLLIGDVKQKITDNVIYIADQDVVQFDDIYLNKDLEIRYIAGYKEHIPYPIKQGILMHVASLYEHTDQDLNINIIDQIKNLYSPYRIMHL